METGSEAGHYTKPAASHVMALTKLKPVRTNLPTSQRLTTSLFAEFTDFASFSSVGANFTEPTLASLPVSPGPMALSCPTPYRCGVDLIHQHRERHAMKSLFLIPMLLSVAWMTPASAHHSAAPHFDLSKSMEIEGTVTKFMLVNPHAYLYFNVTNTQGQATEWRCELPAKASLDRMGWTTALFPAGTKVKINGSPARREDQVCYTNKITLADGRTIGREQRITAVSSGTTQSSTRTTRTAEGKPNFEGFWVSQGGVGGPPNGGAGMGPPTASGMSGPPIGAGASGMSPGPAATTAGAVAAKQYDQRYDDPALKCSPSNIIFGWTHDQNVNKITQTKDALTLTYGYMDFVRTIYLNLSEHPKNLAPSIAGHSIGTWEGDVLVVDTIGFAPGVLIPISGLMHSNQLRVTERFSIDTTANTLTREYRAEDALYLQTAYTGKDVMTLSSKPYTAYNCVELSGKNNQRPN